MGQGMWLLCVCPVLSRAAQHGVCRRGRSTSVRPVGTAQCSHLHFNSSVGTKLVCANAQLH